MVGRMRNIYQSSVFFERAVELYHHKNRTLLWKIDDEVSEGIRDKIVNICQALIIEAGGPREAEV